MTLVCIYEWTRSLSFAFAVCLLVTSCSQLPQPVTVHIEANSYQEEHDEVVSQDSITEYYPSRQELREIVIYNLSGGILDAICLDACCQQMALKVMGSKIMPDGGYQFIRTDDPHVVMVRDYQGVQTLGYLAQNNGGRGLKYLADLQQAQSFEHHGDTVRATDKVGTDTLLVAAMVALVGVAALAGDNADSATTDCSTLGSSTTCMCY
jgi:hypothetical protein